VIGPLFGSILVLAVGVPQSLHVAALSLLWLVVVREFQSWPLAFEPSTAHPSPPSQTETAWLSGSGVPGVPGDARFAHPPAHT
jgi:hypothetical protein